MSHLFLTFEMYNSYCILFLVGQGHWPLYCMVRRDEACIAEAAEATVLCIVECGTMPLASTVLRPLQGNGREEVT
jgi:hypothetical protein